MASSSGSWREDIMCVKVEIRGGKGWISGGQATCLETLMGLIRMDRLCRRISIGVKMRVTAAAS
jgi:hypothetical protein